jgi:heme o synthase
VQRMSEACSEVIVTVATRDRRQVALDLVALTKPRVLVMVLVTTLVGYDVGLTGSPDYLRVIHLLIGTLLAAGGTLALNQYWERDIDGRMDRTRARPLPAGRLQPLEALLSGVALTLLGTAYLAALVGVLVALITAVTAILYLFAYTPLKPRSPLCTLVGAVPGALPPVAGWAAARGDVTLGAWVLFGVLFLWQLPHTLSIARLYRDDYARAGVRVLPVIDPDGASTERQMVLACVALLAVSLVPSVIGWTGPIYLAGALALGLAFTAVGIVQALAPSPRSARRVLLASLLYLPLLLGLLALDKR